MNALLLVVDSLRAQAIRHLAPDGTGPDTPFLASLATRAVHFSRAYASECWTLPSHCSMFTGLLPSRHGAHFQHLEYSSPAPTVAELLGAAGYHTEVVTRNSIFDGTMPGVTRGFSHNTRILSDLPGRNPLALMLALSKPRFRRQIRSSGFFHPWQQERRRFVADFARATVPADRLALEYIFNRLTSLKRMRRPYFLFCNLYDVHAPYPPAASSIFRPFRSLEGCLENLVMPFVLPSLGGHAYLRPGFRLSETSRRLLLGRYHRAIELMDEKLADFYAAAEASSLFEDTLVIVTSDHGEAFGDHELYLHDASVYDTHLHVPLFIQLPDRQPTRVDDVVSTRDLFGLILALCLGREASGTILDADYRRAHSIALAEHFHYPHATHMAERYRQDLVAAVAGHWKAIVRGSRIEIYDLSRDPMESAPDFGTLEDFELLCRRQRLSSAAVECAMSHLRSWSRPSPSSVAGQASLSEATNEPSAPS